MGAGVGCDAARKYDMCVRVLGVMLLAFLICRCVQYMMCGQVLGVMLHAIMIC